MNEYEAELIGLHLGDGTLYQTSRCVVWELRGGLEEKEFYDTHIKKLLYQIFNAEYEPKYRSGGKNGCYGFQLSKKEVITFFLNSGFTPGSKTYTCEIPQNIMKSKSKIQLACLRGLFDSDGCIRFDRINNQKKHTYPKIEIGIASEKLRDNIYEILQSNDFKPNKWNDRLRCFKISLNGVSKTKKFFDMIQPKNVKHLNRHQFWKDNGYFIPRSHK